MMSSTQDLMMPTDDASRSYDAPGEGFSAAPKVPLVPCCITNMLSQLALSGGANQQ